MSTLLGSSELGVMAEAARSAGMQIQKVWDLEVGCAKQEQQQDGGDQKCKSNEADLQTATDRLCEKITVEKLTQNFPGYAIIGEETTAENDGVFQVTEKPTFIIDPIDGTTNFVHRMITCAVLIGFMVNKEMVGAVSLDPIRCEMFYALKGKGFHVQKLTKSLQDDGEPILTRTSGETKLTKSMVCFDVGYKRSPEEVASFLELQRKLLVEGKIRGLRVIGCCGVGMAYIAAGRVDAYIEYDSPYIWDYSGGSLFLQEAGGFASDPSGSPLDFTKRNIFGAASKELADQILKIVND